jgi:hypothetical protein
MSEEPPRGSEYIASVLGAAKEMKAGEFGWIGDMADRRELTLDQFWALGQPPYAAAGQLKVTDDLLPKVIENFIQNRSPGFDITIHPVGQPNNQVNFQTPPANPASWVTGQPSLDALDLPEPDES